MYSFKNDYSELCHPKLLDSLIKNNTLQHTGYGLDEYSIKAATAIESLLNKKADIHFLAGGTQTNMVLISSVLKKYEAIIACDTAHICVHETGAIESRGNKIITAKNVDGKLTPSSIISIMKTHVDEHMVKPKLVFISQTTELGTIYSKGELQKLREICDQYNLYLYIDGARLGSALTSLYTTTTLEDIAIYADAFYIGGTKNGSLLGEALVLINNDFKQNFRFFIKQNGGMLAKGSLLGIMFLGLFKEHTSSQKTSQLTNQGYLLAQKNLFYELASIANNHAHKISTTLINQGFKFRATPQSNQLFPILPNELIKKLEENFQFYTTEKIDKNNSVIRIVTSWFTDASEVKKLINMITQFPFK